MKSRFQGKLATGHDELSLGASFPWERFFQGSEFSLEMTYPFILLACLAMFTNTKDLKVKLLLLLWRFRISELNIYHMIFQINRKRHLFHILVTDSNSSLTISWLYKRIIHNHDRQIAVLDTERQALNDLISVHQSQAKYFLTCTCCKSPRKLTIVSSMITATKVLINIWTVDTIEVIVANQWVTTQL